MSLWGPKIAQKRPFWAPKVPKNGLFWPKMVTIIKGNIFVKEQKWLFHGYHGIQGSLRVTFKCHCHWHCHFQCRWGCWDCLWPNMAISGHFWGVLGPQSAIFGGQKGSKLTPPDVKYNVQHCSTNVQPICGRWDCLWPNMAILGQNGHKMAIKHGLWRPPRSKKGPSTFHYPNLAHRHLIEHS